MQGPRTEDLFALRAASVRKDLAGSCGRAERNNAHNVLLDIKYRTILPYI